MEEETYSTEKTTTRKTDWKMLMEETLETFSNNTISSRGPNNNIAGNDMHIISNGNQETRKTSRQR